MPMYRARHIQYEHSDRVRGLATGGIGAMHRLAQHTGLVAALDRHVTLLKRHVPYHESDHVLNVAYHILCGGTCVQDIERRRQDEVYLDALGARVARATGGVLRRGGDRRGRHAGRDDRAVQGRDGHRLRRGGYHPLLVSLANTGEPLFLVNRSGNRPSSEGAAARFDQARAFKNLRLEAEAVAEFPYQPTAC